MTNDRREEICGERQRVLRFLGDVGGYTAGQIAKACGWETRSDMAIFRTTILHNMLLDGLLAPMDDRKPMIYVTTEAGCAILSDNHAERAKP